MIKYSIVRHIATIKEWGSVSIQLNVIKWGNNPEKYDLRRWEGTAPSKGLTFTSDELESLFDAIGDELDLFEYDSEDSEVDKDIELPSLSEYEDDEESEERYEELDFRSFFVHGDGCCYKKDHGDQEDVIAVLEILRPNMTVEEVEIPATFCVKCNAYYIAEEDYQKVARKGRLLCQLMSDDEYEEYKASLKGFENLNPQSKLNMLGYSVDSQKNYPDKYRRFILTFAIEAGIVTKREAIDHISFLISLHEGHPHFKEALDKWRRDRGFLYGREYTGERKVGSKRIVLNHDDFDNL